MDAIIAAFLLQLQEAEEDQDLILHAFGALPLTILRGLIVFLGSENVEDNPMTSTQYSALYIRKGQTGGSKVRIACILVFYKNLSLKTWVALNS